MKALVLLHIFLLTLPEKSLSETRGNRMELIDLILNFVTMQHKTNKIELSLCWKIDEYKTLLHILNNKSLVYAVNHGIIIPARDRTIIIDYSCNKSRNIFFESFNSMFSPFTIWLLLNFPEEDVSNLHDWKIEIDSNVFLVIKSEKKWQIRSPYKITKQSKDVYFNDIAEFSNKKFQYFNNLIITRNRTDLMGERINVSHVILEPDSMNHLHDYRDKHIDTISKYNYLLMKTIVQYLNFTAVEIFQSTWGYKIPNSTLYTGMMGDLQSGLTEVAGTASFVTADRMALLNYVLPTPTFAKFIFKAPPLSYVSNIFTLPFQTYVWYACFVLIPTVSFVLYIIAKYEIEMIPAENTAGRLRPTVPDVLQVTAGAVFQQGTEADPKSGAGRIATLIIFIALMFLFTSYSANIVALLQSTTESIRTREDLLKSNMILSALDTPFMRHYLARQTEPTRNAIYKKIVSKGNEKNSFLHINIGIRRVQNEFFAFHTEETNAYKVIAETFQESEKCSLVAIEYWSFIEPMTSIRKNSSYNELLKMAWRQLQERGIQNREFKLLYTKKPVCTNQGGNFKSVGMIDCYHVVLIFTIGLMLSLTIFAIEKIIYRISLKKRTMFNSQ